MAPERSDTLLTEAGEFLDLHELALDFRHVRAQFALERSQPALDCHEGIGGVLLYREDVAQRLVQQNGPRRIGAGLFCSIIPKSYELLLDPSDVAFECTPLEGCERRDKENSLPHIPAGSTN